MKSIDLKEYIKQKFRFIEEEIQIKNYMTNNKIKKEIDALDKKQTINEMKYHIGSNIGPFNMKTSAINSARWNAWEKIDLTDESKISISFYDSGSDYLRCYITIKDFFSNNYKNNHIYYVCIDDTSCSYIIRDGHGDWDSTDSYPSTLALTDQYPYTSFLLPGWTQSGYVFESFMNHCNVIYDGSNDMTIVTNIDKISDEAAKQLKANDVLTKIEYKVFTIQKTENNEIMYDYIQETYGYTYNLEFDAIINTKLINSYRPMVEIASTNNIIVDWGDDTITKYDSFTGSLNHNYEEEGLYKVRIYSDSKINYNEVYAWELLYIDLSSTTSFNKITAHKLSCPLNLTNKTGDGILNIYNGCNFDNCDFSGYTTLDNAFTCLDLKSIPTSVNYSKIQNFNYAFYQCTNLTSAEGIDTSAATTAYEMFSSCCMIESIPQLNLPNCTTIDGMFSDCFKLKTVDIVNTSKVTDFRWLCYACLELEEVKTLDVSAGNLFGYMFYECFKLNKVTLTGNASADRIDAVIHELPTNEYDGERIIDISTCTNKDSVTATADGWTILK